MEMVTKPRSSVCKMGDVGERGGCSQSVHFHLSCTAYSFSLLVSSSLSLPISHTRSVWEACLLRRQQSRDPPFRCTQPCCCVLWLELDRMTHFHSKTQCRPLLTPSHPPLSLPPSFPPSLVYRGGPIKRGLSTRQDRRTSSRFCVEHAGEPFGPRLWLRENVEYLQTSLTCYGADGASTEL